MASAELVEATRRWSAEGIVANTVNPGGVATGLQRNFTVEQTASLDSAEAAGVFTYKTIEQGAATIIVAAVAPEFAHTGGHYLDDAQEAYTVPDDADLAQHPHGVKEWALKHRDCRAPLDGVVTTDPPVIFGPERRSRGAT